MEFDRTAFHHTLSVAPWAPGAYDVFVRTDDGTVEHYWAGDGVMFGPELLGGRFNTDPVAAWQFDDLGGHLHLIGRSGIRLVDWHWEVSHQSGPLGAPMVDTLPGFCVADPEVVNTGRLEVFAAGVEGPLRHWSRGPEGWNAPERLGSESAHSRPAAVSRAPGVVDVFAVSSNNGGLQHWFRNDKGWQSEFLGGARLVDRPTVASYEENRLDVFALGHDGVPAHWGWNGARWFKDEGRLDMTTSPAHTVLAAPGLQLVSFGVERLALVTRTTDGLLVDWILEPPLRWAGASEFSASEHLPTAWSSEQDQVDVLARNADGSFTHNFFVNRPGLGMGEPVVPDRSDETLTLAEPEPPPRSLTPTVVDPDLMMTRPEDLVLLGVRWSGVTVETPPERPAELVAAASAELTVLFPPQHVVEEVVRGEGPAVPVLDPVTTAGFPTWRAGLSGPSRVVVALDSGTRVTLTIDGVLDALRTGRLLPSEGILDRKTAIEMPYRLVISPHTPGPDGDIRCSHPATVVASEAGSVGTWQTTIAAAGTPAGAAAGLVLRAIDADSADPFPVPLTGGSRGRILVEEPTARIDRLTLSTLGGSLTTAGSWDTFEWEHVAAAGRDRRVRTATRGVLYPFGHRAEYVEVTERSFEPSSAGATAHLRKVTSLRVTEPLRREPDDVAVRAAFPFAEVELERTFHEGVDAVWQQLPLPTPEQDALLSTSDILGSQARQSYENLFGDMGPGSDDPAVEDLADGLGEGAGELLNPDDPDSGTKAAAALAYLEIKEQIAHIKEQLAALPHGGVAHLDVFFVPTVQGTPLAFPVRLAGQLGDVHVSMPLVFVADIERGRGLFTAPFSSLTDPDIATRVAEAYQDAGGGAVDVGGTRIDLVRSSDPELNDVCEVQLLNIVGTAHDGGFRPRLGAAPTPGEQDVPTAARWGFETALPAVRALLGPDHPPLRMALSRSLLDAATDLEIPFQVPEGAAPLVTDFAADTARSGGIVAPDIVADGISRLHGPVSVAGMLSRAGGSLDPRKILGDGASLLGFHLADLIDASALDVPPAILQVLEEGKPPKATMQWRHVALATETGSFVTGPGSSLDLDVVVGVEGQAITCTVENVILALPDRDPATKLLEITLDKVVFTQHGGQAPSLDVDGVGAEFFGLLNLLKKLQEAVDLGGSGPHIDASSKGVSASYTLPVPDVTAGAFQMTGLVFHAAIDVPFDDRPVTISLAFASREKPFNLSVLMFGGGGYVDLMIDRTGLRRLEASLEFGASVAVNFVVATGEVHAMGGVRLIKDDAGISLGGYLRFGGSVSIFGLITASVELSLLLTYDDRNNQMTGRATLVLEVDLTLVSKSVELDSGTWVLIGGGSAGQELDARSRFTAFLESEEPPEEWRRYRAAFAARTRS